jgi:hypothetical protein
MFSLNLIERLTSALVKRLSLARVGVRAAQVDPKKIETYIYVYGGELADPGPRLGQAVLNVTPRPIAMRSLN